MSANVVDTINEKMYEDLKKFLRELRRLAMELYRAHNEKERQAALQKILEEIANADKMLDEKMDLIKQKNNELNEKQAELNRLKESKETPQAQLQNKSYKELLPDTYEEMRQELTDITKEKLDLEHRFIKNTIEIMPTMKTQSTDTKERFIINKLNEIDVNQKAQAQVMTMTYQDFFKGYENNEDWKEFLTEYLATQYTDADITEYTDNEGKINYYDLLQETEIEGDIFMPLLNEMSQDIRTTQQLKDYREELKGQHGDFDSMIDNIDNNRAAAVVNNKTTDDLEL